MQLPDEPRHIRRICKAFSIPCRRLGAVALTLAFFAGCADAPPPVNVVSTTVPSDLRDVWRQLLQERPLPEGYRLAESVAGERTVARGAVTLARSGWAEDTPPSNAVVLSRTPYAPWVPLHDLRVSVTEEEAATGAVPVAPLLDIAPPRRGVAVDGRYPTDPDYPLVEEVYVTVATEDATLRAWQAGIPSAAPAKPIVWISAVGDMMLSRGIDRALLSGDAGIQRTFADTLPILQEADLLLGNLEGAVTRRGTPAEKSYTFRFPPEVLSPLGRVGFDYVSLTNNHAYDYGEPGFLDTLDNLSRSEIATSGAGRSLEEARRSWDTTVRGQPVRVLSLGAYPRERNGFDGLRQASARDDRAGILWATDQLIADLPELLSGAGFTIVMVHGGQEWAERPTEGQRRLYRQLADAGADLVVGSHPHVVQGLEGYRGSLIAYSLGNFLFNGMQQTRYGEESVILTVGAHEGAIRYVEPKPVQISGPRVSLDKSGSILERLSARTQELNQ